MRFSPGTRLQNYEIVAPIGAGGMGEVYRARDERLSREVALKVLPAEISADPERLARFSREARLVSSLNHPNIVTIYDIGQSGDTSFIAMELIEGQTLREVLAAGPLSPRKLLALAIQAAEGLARAHEAGVVHRDLKPENLMVTRDGFVKILDFGLAKLVERPEENLSVTPTADIATTRHGVILGTVGYMSPEQASGNAVDHRCDQFALGAILYEMAAGGRAFQGGNAISTLSSILRDEPESLAERNPAVPAPLRWLIERCLSKDPSERYASTRDLARELGVIQDHASEAVLPVADIAASPRRRRVVRSAGLGLAAVLLAAIAFIAGRRTGNDSPPSFKQLTFQRGTIGSARFASDGQTIVFGAAWSGKPFHLFEARTESPESRSLDLPDADILAISSSGQMAISLGRHFYRTFDVTGLLAQAALSGGAPRPLAEDVSWADWSPDGKELAVVRQAAGKSRLEFPIGKTLFETSGWISHPRVSPRGDRVAFLNHPDYIDPRGSVGVVERSGKSRVFPREWRYAAGLAWLPDASEIWFTGGAPGEDNSLQAVSLSGRERRVLIVPGMLRLHDIARDGRVLLARDAERIGMNALAPGALTERDLSWFDHSTVRDISPDGRKLLYFEGGIGKPDYPVYLGGTDGSAPVRIGEGLPTELSPDGGWALSSLSQTAPPQLWIFSTGPGQPRSITRDSIIHSWASWLPDGKRVLFAGSEPGKGVRLYIQDLAGGSPRAITGEGVSLQWHGVSPDGTRVAAVGPDNRVSIYPIEGGAAIPVPGLSTGDEPIRWSGDGQSLFVYRRGVLPARVDRVDVLTGGRRLWKEISPADPAGVTGIIRIRLTPDASAYAYSYRRVLSDLYLVDGLR